MNDEPATEILDATYQALCKHGYADLTLHNIAAETDKSKATIHYYYDTKDDLFAAFLEYLHEQYTTHIDAAGGETPREHLHSLLDILLLNDTDAPGEEFQTAILEVKAQAPYNAAIQERLAEFDAFLFEQLRDTIAAGVRAGELDDSVDPADEAEFLTTTIEGAHTRQVAVDRSPERLHRTMTEYVDTHLTAIETMEEAH